MDEVLYNINGKYLKDFGVFISSSKGLMDKPKPKPRKSYDWAEYHGKAVDLSKPKYDEREIELQGWIEGEDWAKMKQNFDALMNEFDKEGLVRLVIEYLNNALVYDVYLSDDVELKKEFRNGKMIGFFELKMKEPQPIKKVYKLIGSDLQLSFNSGKWVDINIDGISETQKGSISIDKMLNDRALSGYGYRGRNYIRDAESVKLEGYSGSNVIYTENYQVSEWDTNKAVRHQITGGESNIKAINTVEINNSIGEEFRTLSFFVKNFSSSPLTFYSNLNNLNTTVGPNEAIRVVWNVQGDNERHLQIQCRTAGSDFAIWRVKNEKGNKATDWSPAPEEVHYITISGNVDEITNIETNAEELWSL